MKVCGRCKEEKSESEFNKNARKPDGLQYQCRSCTKTHYKNVTYKTDTERERLRRNKSAHLARCRARYQALKTGPCADCGIVYPHYVMDFDHLDGAEKLHNVSNLMASSLEKLIEEIQKCDLVCANCHRARTWNRQNALVA